MWEYRGCNSDYNTGNLLILSERQISLSLPPTTATYNKACLGTFSPVILVVLFCDLGWQCSNRKLSFLLEFGLELLNFPYQVVLAILVVVILHVSVPALSI